VRGGDDRAAQFPQLLAVRAAERVLAVGVGVVAAPHDVGDVGVGVRDQPVPEVDELVQVRFRQSHDACQHPDRDFLERDAARRGEGGTSLLAVTMSWYLCTDQ